MSGKGLGLYRNALTPRYYNIVLTDVGLCILVDTTGSKIYDVNFIGACEKVL